MTSENLQDVELGENQEADNSLLLLSQSSPTAAFAPSVPLGEASTVAATRKAAYEAKEVEQRKVAARRRAAYEAKIKAAREVGETATGAEDNSECSRAFARRLLKEAAQIQSAVDSTALDDFDFTIDGEEDWISEAVAQAKKNVDYRESKVPEEQQEAEAAARAEFAWELMRTAQQRPEQKQSVTDYAGWLGGVAAKTGEERVGVEKKFYEAEEWESLVAEARAAVQKAVERTKAPGQAAEEAERTNNFGRFFSRPKKLAAQAKEEDEWGSLVAEAQAAIHNTAEGAPAQATVEETRLLRQEAEAKVAQLKAARGLYKRPSLKKVLGWPAKAIGSAIKARAIARLNKAEKRAAAEWWNKAAEQRKLELLKKAEAKAVDDADDAVFLAEAAAEQHAIALANLEKAKARVVLKRQYAAEAKADAKTKAAELKAAQEALTVAEKGVWPKVTARKEAAVEELRKRALEEQKVRLREELARQKEEAAAKAKAAAEALIVAQAKASELSDAQEVQKSAKNLAEAQATAFYSAVESLSHKDAELEQVKAELAQAEADAEAAKLAGLEASEAKAAVEGELKQLAHKGSR